MKNKALLLTLGCMFVAPAIAQISPEVHKPSFELVTPQTRPNPLSVPTRINYVKEHKTVGDAIRYYLEPIGYRWVERFPAPNDAKFIADKPLPPHAKSHQVLAIQKALLILIGRDNRLVVDHHHRLVSAESLTTPELVPKRTIRSNELKGKVIRSLPTKLGSLTKSTEIKQINEKKRADEVLESKNTFIVSFPNENGLSPLTSSFTGWVVSHLEDGANKVVIVGHSHGWSRVGNSKLAVERTETVTNMLLKAGVDINKIRKKAIWSGDKDIGGTSRGVEIRVI